MKFILFLLLFNNVAMCCKHENSASIINIKKAINICISEYMAISNSSLSSDVDRVYVHKFYDEGLGMVFANGEVGTFGKRYSKYKSNLSCGLTKNNEIYFLSEPLKNPLINYNSSDDLYDKEVIEFLFLKEKGNFIFIKSQLLNKD